jgi:hypothetical protein
MPKTFSFGRSDRRAFLRTGIIGSTGLVVAQFLVPKELRASTTLTYQVSQSSDDAQEGLEGGINLTSGSVTLISSDVHCGFRFQDVAVAQATTLISASISFDILTYTAPTGPLIYCEAADNSLTFTTSKKWDISLRPHTVDSTGCNATGTGWQSTDITACVQDVINRAGWVSGNALSVLTVANSGSYNGNLVASTYDASPSTAAILTINY